MSLTRSLNAVEIRVLGALMEKEQTTPDHYPLTVNALMAACNQKSNREPVTALTETEVVGTLDALRSDVLAWGSEGARVEHWEHRLDRRWHLSSKSKALMTLLLLRGPQTPGELKNRSERMHAFSSADEVEAVLEELAEGGDDALVRTLPRRPGQRESRWMHRVGTEEVEALYGTGTAAAAPAAAPTLAPTSAPGSTASARPAAPSLAPPSSSRQIEDRLEALESAVEGLREELTALRRRLGDLD
jgi:uncharacterized protein YceH (UPF0502 family)